MEKAHYSVEDLFMISVVSLRSTFVCTIFIRLHPFICYSPFPLYVLPLYLALCSFRFLARRVPRFRKAQYSSYVTFVRRLLCPDWTRQLSTSSTRETRR
jgi:hypothetical protein